MKIQSWERRKRNRRNLTIRQLERLEGRQLLSSMTEYTIPTSIPRPTDVTSGPDGTLWFAEDNGDKIGRITTAGTVTEFGLPDGSAPDYITTGPDNNLWFTDPGNNAIGRITTAGIVTEFTVPTSSSGPAGITTGPDGNLWFGEQTGNQIGRITTSGTITEYGLGTLSSPYEIVTGSDGNLWFTEINNDMVGKIVPSGVNAGTVTLYPTASGSGPRGITAGSDGNLWFTEGGLSQIGRITTAGVLNEFAGPSGSNASEITSGPGGDLYISDDGNNAIDQMDTSGTLINAYPTTTSGAAPDGLTEGPDNNIWFSEYIGDQIGTLSLISASTLTVSASSGTYGGTTSVQAHLTSDSSNVGNEAVDFHIGAVDLGQATTDSVTGIATLNNASLALINAGTYIGDITASFVGDSTYAASSGSADLTVTPAHLTITANNQTKVYGAALPTLTASYTGFVNGDTSASLTTQPTIATSASRYSPVLSSPYSITASAAVDSNYTISYIAGSLVETPAPLIILIDSSSKLYGQAVPTLTGTVEGILSDDIVSATYSTSATNTGDVVLGGYPITLLGLVGEQATNYSTTVEGGSVTDGTLTVTPAPLVVLVGSQSRTYGQPNITPTSIVSGVLFGDHVTVTYDTTATQFSDVTLGGYPITASGLSGAKGQDYSLSVEGSSVTPGTLTVTPAPLAIVATNLYRFYGQANAPLTGTVAGILNGDDVNATYSTTATIASHVVGGGYPITITGLSGSKAGDYAIGAATPGTLTVVPTPLTITALTQFKQYGQANPTFNSTETGFVLGQGPNVLTGTLSYATTATAASHYGLYPVTPSGLSSSDYAISYVAGGLAVNPAPLTIIANSFGKTYGQAVPTLTASYSGFVNGDTPASLPGQVGFYTPMTAASHMGYYPVIVGGAASLDYTITYQNGLSAVFPAFLTVTPSSAVAVLGQPFPLLTVSYSGFVNGDTAANLLTQPFALTSGTPSSAPGYYLTNAIGGSSYDYVINHNYGFLDVVNNPAQVAYVTSLYVEILGRAPEPDGLNFWVKTIDQGLAEDTVALMIYDSPEAVLYRANHPGQTVTLGQAYVIALQAQLQVILSA